MNENICPQCKNNINESTNRLIQDTCGHKKCRICLLQEETGCKICNNTTVVDKNTLKSNSNTSVIKYDTKVHNETKIVTTETKATNEVENIEDCEIHNKIPHIIIISKSPTTYKCTICTKTFNTNASVKYHSYCGGIEKPLKCEICNKGFISKSHLEAHKLKHTGIRPFSCSKCHKTFTQKSKLNRHSKIHSGERPFACTECGKSFTNKDALTGHFRLHSGEQPYSCKECGTKFNNKSNLTKHLATHSKDKIYMCEECGKKFGNKWALVSHSKCHNKERPYNCQKCSKNFSKIKDLKRHSLSHLDVKPFGCKLCSIKFCRKDNLERHLKNTHSIKDVNEIKSASKKIINESNASLKTNKKIIETEDKDENKLKPCPENPNAINVIKMSNKSTAPPNPVDIPTIRNAVPVINGPFKLAFKTDAFKNNYNILKREYNEESLPRIQSMKPYDMKESLNICQKILLPMNTTSIKNDKIIDNNINANKIPIKNVNEKDSLEICKKILTPDTPLHYETSFEHKKHAVIKNIKFKLPSTYTNNAIKSNCNDTEPEVNDTNIKQYTELQPVKYNIDESSVINYKQSVIVNNLTSDHSQKEISFNEMHWRRRTAQSFQPKLNN